MYPFGEKVIKTLLFAIVVLSVSSPLEAQDSLTVEEYNLSRSNEFMLKQVLSAIDSKGSVADEIELVDNQRQALRAISGRLEKRIRRIDLELAAEQAELEAKSEIADQFGIASTLDDNQRNERRAVLLFQANKEALREISDSLVPQQLDRLNQLAIQYQYSIGHGFGFELIPALADKLELSSQEKRSVTDAVRAASAEYDAEIKKLRQKLDQQVLKSLSREGQERIREMIGEFYYAGKVR
jgi:hypothetical protein